MDRAIYSAVAATPTPSLDEPLRRLSNSANNSRLWLAIATGLRATEAGRAGGPRRGNSGKQHELPDGADAEGKGVNNDEVPVA